MASTYTGLGTELMTTGENAGNWGTKTNTNLQIIEQIAGGYVEQSVTSTPTTLSVSDGSAGATLAHRIIKFTGTISEATTVTVPLDVQQMYVLVNGTSGAYTLTFKYVTGSGSTVAWAATDKGTKIVYAAADHATNPNMVDTGISTNTLTGVTGDITIDSPADIILDADGANVTIKDGGTTTLDIVSNGATDVTLDAPGDIKLDADGGDVFFVDGGTTFGSATNTSGNLIIKSGTTTAVTFSGANATIAGDLTISGDDLTMGTNTDTAIMVADGTNFNPVVPSGDVGLTNAGVFSIASGVIVNADINSSAAIADSKLATISTAGKVDIGALEIDGATDIGEALADADLLIVDNGAGGTERKAAMSRVQTYIEGKISGDITISSGTAAIGSGVIVNADINSSAAIADSKLATISTADKVSGAAIQVDGATDGTSITVASSDKLIVDDAGTTKYITVSQLPSTATAADDIGTGDGAVTLTTSSGNITIDAAANDTDIIFKGTDGGADTTFLTIDGSAAGAATFNDKIIATELDISGNCDIDGTTNLDAVDIDGAVQLDSTFTVGVDDTGYDVKFFGATSGSYMLWDESTDDLILAGAAKLYLYDAGGGEYISSSGSALTIASGGVAWELPAADGSANQYLKTDGSGNLDWATASGIGMGKAIAAALVFG